MDDKQPIRINVEDVVRSRLGKRARFVPHFLVEALSRLICQDKLNALLERNFPLRGADFCEGVLRTLSVRLDVRGEENLPSCKRMIVVSNHPLGGLDGMSMIHWLSRYYECDVRFVVNDLLMAVEPLRECFVPVNKTGRQNRGHATALDTALEEDNPVVIYPAGLCSRLGDNGEILDLRWHKMVVNKAIEHHRDIVPVYFDGRNSRSFYRAAKWRARLGIKFNFEMMLLPREVFRSAGKTFTLTVGSPVSWQSLKGGFEAQDTVDFLKKTVYALRAK